MLDKKDVKIWVKAQIAKAILKTKTMTEPSRYQTLKHTTGHL